VRHLTHHREETPILLLSPLLYIYENYNGGSLINYTHIHNPKDGHSYQIIVRGMYKSPAHKRRQTVLCLSIAGLYNTNKAWQ